MARADRRRAQREARNARSAGGRSASGKRHQSARVVENTLFFTRLRTQAKWAFAVMVVVFGAGFAFLGVGSGGLDLGSLIRDTFGAKGGGGTSISKALKDVGKHPHQAAAYKALADAYEKKGRIDDTISALDEYTKLAPKDASQIERLAKLESNKAQTALQNAQAAFVAQQATSGGSTFGGKLNQALGQDPIAQAVNTNVSSQAQAATTAYQSAASQAVATFKQLTKARPDQASYFELARAAEQFQDPKTALGAYKKLLKMISDPAEKRALRARVASLQASIKKSGG